MPHIWRVASQMDIFRSKPYEMVLPDLCPTLRVRRKFTNEENELSTDAAGHGLALTCQPSWQDKQLLEPGDDSLCLGTRCLHFQESSSSQGERVPDCGRVHYWWLYFAEWLSLSEVCVVESKLAFLIKKRILVHLLCPCVRKRILHTLQEMTQSCFAASESSGQWPNCKQLVS